MGSEMCIRDSIHIYTHTHIHEKFLFHVRQAESKWNDDVINQTPISHVPSLLCKDHQLTEVGVQQACDLAEVMGSTFEAGARFLQWWASLDTRWPCHRECRKCKPATKVCSDYDDVGLLSSLFCLGT